MAGKKLANYLMNRYQEGGLVESSALAAPVEPRIDEYSQVEDWDTGLAKWLVDVLGTEAGSMPRHPSERPYPGETIGTTQDDFTTQMKGLVDWTKSTGQGLQEMGLFPSSAKQAAQRFMPVPYMMAQQIEGGLDIGRKMLSSPQENAHDVIDAEIENNNIKNLLDSLLQQRNQNMRNFRK